ncbi:MAG: hypothetical protein ACLUNZ_01060 [Evtepia sp.]
MSNSTHGYVTVNYILERKTQGRHPVQRRQDRITATARAARMLPSLDQGNGKYTVTLYRNVSGTVLSSRSSPRP